MLVGIPRKLTHVNMLQGAIARGAKPFDPGEFEVAYVAFRAGAVGLFELDGQGAASNPIAGCILFEDGGVERVHSVQFEDDTAVQKRRTLHNNYFLRIGLYPSFTRRERMASASLISPKGPS